MNNEHTYSVSYHMLHVNSVFQILEKNNQRTVLTDKKKNKTENRSKVFGTR